MPALHAATTSRTRCAALAGDQALDRAGVESPPKTLERALDLRHVVAGHEVHRLQLLGGHVASVVGRLPLGANGERAAVRLDDDPSVHVGAQRAETRLRRKRCEGLGTRMVVVVVRADRDHGDRGAQHTEQIGQAGVLGAVMRDLQDLDRAEVQAAT